MILELPSVEIFPRGHDKKNEPKKSSGRRKICRGGTGYEHRERLCRIKGLHSARWQETQSPQRVMRKDGPWKWTSHRYS